MRIQATCDSCFHDFSVSENSAGKRVRCPECNEPVRVPDGNDDDAPPARRPSSKSGGRRSEKKQKPAQSQNGALIGAGVGVGVVVVGGLVAFLVMGQGAGRVASVPAGSQASVAAMPQAHMPAGAAHSQAGMAHSAPPGMAHSSPAAMAHSTPPATAHSGPPMQTNPAVVAPVATPTSSPTNPAAVAATPGKSDAAPQKPAEQRVKYDMVELIAKVEPSVVRISATGQKGGQTGSGFVVDTKGTVVTNVHVLEGASKIDVEFSNGAKAPVVGFRLLDQKRDIAIIKIDMAADKLTPVPLATALPPKGLSVIAFGAPLGLSFTSSDGIVSALRPAEEMREQFGADFEGEWIQTSTPISPGNSGGPLVNHFGEVVAMNTMQVSSGQNLNFAMSSVDIIDALSKAPDEVKPISAGAVKSLPSSRSRSMASDETETDRGRRLLSDVSEIFLLNATSRKMLALDPTGQIWNKVITRSKAAVEKSKIQLSFGEPSDDAAIMFVVVELKTSRKKTVNAGTQELYISAEVICKDDSAKKGESKVCRIWKDEEVLGTISLDSLMNGVYPRTAEENLFKFFNKFRADCVKARQVQKTGDGASDKDKSATKAK